VYVTFLAIGLLLLVVDVTIFSQEDVAIFDDQDPFVPIPAPVRTLIVPRIPGLEIYRHPLVRAFGVDATVHRADQFIGSFAIQ
jgi:hypothetical protein